MLERLLSFMRDPDRAREVEFLASIPLFSALERRDIARILARLTEHTYRPGEVIFQEADIGRALFIVVSGKVEIYRDLSGGGRRRLSFVEPGGYFGEMAIIAAIPRTASARAEGETKVYLFDKKMLEALMMRYPAIGMAIQAHFHRSLAERFLELSNRLPAAGEPKAAAGPAAGNGEPVPLANGGAGTEERVAELERALGRMALELERLRREGLKGR